MENFNLNISEGNKELLKSAWPLILVIILFIVVGKIAITQIGSINKQIVDAKKTQTILDTKLNTLQSTASISESGSEFAVTALPKSNPSIMVISQLKILSTQYPVVISNIRSSFSESNSSNMTYISTSFDLTGKPEDVSAFIKAIDNIAPITKVQKISITSSANLYTANISAQTFYSQFPATIPSITQPVSDLTAKERELLTKLSTLTQPLAVPSLTPSNGNTTINPNPFGI